MFKSIKEQLDSLQVSIDRLMGRPRTKSDASTPDFLPVPVPEFPVRLDSHEQNLNANDTSGICNEPMPCTSSYLDDFIDEQLSDQLLNLMNSHDEEFRKNSERGHGVISFGEPYDYKGAKASKPLSKTFPEELTKLVDLIKNRIQIQLSINA